ncbi:MAG: histone deacetylase [Acidobacteriota bacterium]
MILAVATDERFALHEPPPGHPERFERAEVFDVVAARARERGAMALPMVEATDGQLGRVHEGTYLERLAALSGRAAMLDPDTFTSPESVALARLAAGACTTGVDRMLDGAVDRVAALVRPPGHHAEPGRAMGFCLVNNAAVAAAHALARGVPRVAVVDFDVHHGNGTQAAFAAEPRVLYVSTHQWPFYPGSGSVSEVGRGEGEGYTVNIPMEAGSGDSDYDAVFSQVVIPVLQEYAPSLLIISAGYDAHERDPLGGMRMSESGYATLMSRLASATQSCCAGRMLLVTEGGYDLTALASALDASLRVMAGETRADAPECDTPCPRGARASVQARAVQARYWRGL